MEEIVQFQNRLNNLNESLDDRNIEDVGTIELTSLREALTNLLGELDSFIRECRANSDEYDDETAVELMVSGLKTRNQIRELRNEVVSELLLKESKIDSLHREEEQILNLESSLSGFTVADELNMTDVERAVKNLSSTFPRRKEEISKELDELENGRTSKKEKKEKEETNRVGGAHLSKEDRESLEEVNNTIDGVEFGDSNDEVPSELSNEEPGESLIPIPGLLGGENDIPSQSDEKEEELLETPEERKDDAIPGAIPNELDEPTEETNSSETLLDVPEEKTEEDEDEFRNIPIPVTEIVQPKPALWQKVGLAITGAIGFMATAIAVHTGLGARYLKNLANNNEATIQEDNSEERVVSDVVDAIQHGKDLASIPSSESQPEPVPEPAPEPVPEPQPEPQPEPAPEPIPEPVPEPIPEPQPEPIPEPQPEPQPQEEEIPIYLEPGESVVDTNTGVEITSTGESYIHDGENTAPIENKVLEYTEDGSAIVHNSDFEYNGPAPEPVPAPQAEAPLLVDESNVQSADAHLAELQQQGNLEEAEDFSNAMDAIDWDSILGSGPSL